MEIDRQIIIYLNQIDLQNQLYKKIRKLKYLQDQFVIKEETNLLHVLNGQNPLWMETRQYNKIRLSLNKLQENEQITGLLRKIAQRNGLQKMARTESEPLSVDDLKEHIKEINEVDPLEIWNAFCAQGNNLFDFLLTFDYKKH